MDRARADGSARAVAAADDHRRPRQQTGQRSSLRRHAADDGRGREERRQLGGIQPRRLSQRHGPSRAPPGQTGLCSMRRNNRWQRLRSAETRRSP